MSDIFVSYKSGNVQCVARLAQALQRAWRPEVGSLESQQSLRLTQRRADLLIMKFCEQRGQGKASKIVF